MRTTNSKSLENGLKTVVEPTRLLIIALLARYGELCVAQLVSALGMPQAGVSQHLRVLRSHGIVEMEREGLWIYYNLMPEKIFDLIDNLKTLVSGDYPIPRTVASRLKASYVSHPRRISSRIESERYTPSIF